MLNLSLKEWKLIAKSRNIKCYKGVSKNKLIGSLEASKPIKRSKTTNDIRKKDFNTDEMLKGIRNFFRQEKDRQRH